MAIVKLVIAHPMPISTFWILFFRLFYIWEKTHSGILNHLIYTWILIISHKNYLLDNKINSK